MKRTQRIIILSIMVVHFSANAQIYHKWYESYFLLPRYDAKDNIPYGASIHYGFSHRYEPANLVENFIINQTSKRDGLKGKPYYVNTYPAKIVSDWGEKHLEVGAMRDSISYNHDGLRIYYETPKWKQALRYFYSNQKLDSVQLTKVYHNEGPNGETEYRPEELYKIKWVTPDSAIVNLYECEYNRRETMEPVSQWRHKMRPDYLSITYFIRKSEDPIFEIIEYKKPYIMIKSNNQELLHTSYRDVYAFSEGNGYYDRITFELNDKGQIIEENRTDLIKECLAKDPEKRPGYSKILYLYNEHGDISQLLVKHLKFNWTRKEYQIDRTDTIKYEYEYDNHDNWIYRKCTDSRNRDNRIAHEVRKIMYYDTPEFDEMVKYEEELENNKIYRVVDSPAYFSKDGSDGVVRSGAAESEWIWNVEYQLDNGGNQRVYRATVIVEKDGSLSNISVDERGTEDYIKEELIRVINLMPRMTPAYVNGKPVRSRYTFGFPLQEILRSQARKKEAEEEILKRQQMIESYKQQQIEAEKNLKKSQKKEKRKRIVNEILLGHP